MATERVLTEDQLAQRVHDGFAKKYQEEITIEDVRHALKDLRLADPPARPACQLRINRLRFGGQKTLKDEPEVIPIRYDQEFKPGVNVVLIEDNDVGKSSILKTIKFALTGHDGDYDADVKQWITDIHLQFSLNDDCYTVVISRIEGQFGVLYTGVEDRQPDDVQEHVIVFTAADRNEFQDSLQQFFFDRIGLTRLAWTLPPSRGQDAAREGGTTWLTYFQAMHIPDGGDRYLLCDKEHSFGNQEGLIFSSFLGLHLVEQLNWLGVESSKQKKLEQGTTVERDDLMKSLDHLEDRNREVAEQLENLSRHLSDRRDSFLAGRIQEQIAAIQDEIASQRSRQVESNREIADLSELLSHTRAREAQLRELIALKLHFTGLNVRLCPNCDADVSEADIEQEHETHQCRLCNKPAHDATPEEITTRRAEADDFAEQVKEQEKRRAAVKREIERLDQEIQQLRKKAVEVQSAAQESLRNALPTQGEQELRDRLLQESGKLSAEMAALSQRLEQLGDAR